MKSFFAKPLKLSLLGRFVCVGGVENGVWEGCCPSLFYLSPFSPPSSLPLPLMQDGSTVASVLVLDDVIYSANLGDSKAILCRRAAPEKNNQLAFVSLTKDHNPSNVCSAYDFFY